MKTKVVALEEITIPTGRRRPTEDRVESIARSMDEVGLLHPLVVRETTGCDTDYRLIAGQTRLLAAKRLGWDLINVSVFKEDAIHAELAEIVENIERSNLSALEEAEALKRMKEIYLALHPETKTINEKGGPGRGKTSEKQGSKTNDKMSSVLPFTEDTAQKTGKNQRSIQRSVALAEKLTDAAKTQISGTKIENSKAELKKLSDLPPDQQEKVAKVIGSGKAKTVAEAKKVAGVEKPKQGEQKRDPRVWSEIEKNLGHALNKVNDLHRMYPNRPMHGTLMMQIKQAMKTLRGWKESIK